MNARTLILPLLLASLSAPAIGQAPDLVVDDIFDHRNWGQVGDLVAYSIGTEACNLGDADADWDSDTPDHPVIAQNMYRLKDDRMEQIGMSWVKHGFFAVNGSACGPCQNPGTGTLLGVGCSDPYDASLNGDQNGISGVGGLGPRSEVDAATGVFPFPYTGIGESGDAIFRRIQVHVDDVTPALNAGARYFVEGQYVSADEAASGGDATNNATYREVSVDASLNLSFADVSQPGRSAVLAWQDVDPGVTVSFLDVLSDGRFVLGARASDLGGGQWRYEYALQNLSSHRSARSFQVTVPAGVTVTNPDFHDVDYHSGEPYSGVDWSVNVPDAAGGFVTWTTASFVVDPDANALRWGTMYNFSFDADAPPVTGEARVRLFRSGAPSVMQVSTTVPGDVGGGIPCEDVLSLQAICTASSELRAQVRLTDGSHDGETLTLSVDGVLESLTVSGDRARLRQPGAASGPHDVVLSDPGECVPDRVVDCP